MRKQIAYFITPHGFGHAARSAAIMDALLAQNPEMIFEIFTTVPEWFFNESVHGQFHYHALRTDIGLVQTTSMSEDLPATLKELETYFTSMPETIQSVIKDLRDIHLDAVISDVSPLGIEVGTQLGIPNFLMENFTWDWIYENYLTEYPGFMPFIDKMAKINLKPDFHIQTEPACLYLSNADLIANPISRIPFKTREVTRKQLGIPNEPLAILVSLGGIPSQFAFLDKLQALKDIYFVIPGSAEKIISQNNLRLLPHHSNFYHPDLMNAVDAVIGKAGYSTIAEAYWAGIPFGYMVREGFRESGPLGIYINKHLSGIRLSDGDFEEGDWLSKVQELISQPRQSRNGINGSNEVAHFITAQIEG